MRLDQADRIMLGDREVSRVYLGANLVWTSEFSPVSLFAQGEPGVWYDPSDFSTLFQDAAGTTPVTAVEQPVGRILDKSGRGFHATQATATSRPVLRQDGSGKHYLYFDGVDDFLVTPTITPEVDKAQVFAGVRKVAVATTQMIVELSANLNANNGSIYLVVSNVTDRGYAFSSKGTSSTTPAFYSLTTPSTETAVITATGSISEDYVALRRNGVDATPSTSDQGTGNYGNYPLYIGCRGGTTLPFKGHLYGLIVRFGSNLPIETIEQAETWINSKTGAY